MTGVPLTVNKTEIKREIRRQMQAIRGDWFCDKFTQISDSVHTHLHFMIVREIRSMVKNHGTCGKTFRVPT